MEDFGNIEQADDVAVFVTDGLLFVDGLEGQGEERWMCLRDAGNAWRP